MKLRYTSQLMYAAGWLILAIGVVWYVNMSRAATVECMYRAQEETNTGTQATRVASQKRDDALVESKTALRQLIRLRVIEGQPNDDPTVQRSARIYWYATGDFIEASKDLDEARDANPVPDVRELCGVGKGREKGKGNGAK